MLLTHDAIGYGVRFQGLIPCLAMLRCMLRYHKKQNISNALKADGIVSLIYHTAPETERLGENWQQKPCRRRRYSSRVHEVSTVVGGKSLRRKGFVFCNTGIGFVPEVICGAACLLFVWLQVVITDLQNRQWKYYFPCGQWLATDEGDGQTSRDLQGSLDPMGVRKGEQMFQALSTRAIFRSNMLKATVWLVAFNFDTMLMWTRP